jgi:hypothetical protein
MRRHVGEMQARIVELEEENSGLREPPGANPAAPATCSFCLKDASQVSSLLKGEKALICDERSSISKNRGVGSEFYALAVWN